MLKPSNKNSFTLIELLIVIALIVVITALAIPLSIEFLQERRVEEETIFLADSLKTAQARAMAGKLDSAWGIRLYEDYYVLFAGDSFDERLTQYDETFRLSPGTEISYDQEEIVFEKFIGKPIIQ